MREIESQGKHVLIVEPSASGHHMALYVRHVVRGLIAEGWKVSLLTTRDAVAHPAFNFVRGEMSDGLPLYFLPSIPPSGSTAALSLMAQQVRSWLTLRREFRRIAPKVRADVIYLPTMDWVAKGIELMGSPFGEASFVGLYMSVTHHRQSTGLGPAGRQDWMYDLLFRRLLRIKSLKKVLVIDEVFHGFVKKHYGKFAGKIEFVPDFGEIRGNRSRDEARKELGVSPEARVLLVYGSLTHRKGIAQLLAALSHPETPRDFIVLLAGVPSGEIRTLVDGPSMEALRDNGRILTQFVFHEAADEYRVFRASDFVWLGYTGRFYGSSGVLYQAVSAGLPVVAMKQGLVGHLVAAHGLGLTLDPANTAEISSAIVRMCADDPQSYLVSEQARLFINEHTSQGHVDAVMGALSSSGSPLNRNA